jgi:hypothetical protein
MGQANVWCIHHVAGIAVGGAHAKRDQESQITWYR